MSGHYFICVSHPCPTMRHIDCNCKCLLKEWIRKNTMFLYYTPRQPSVKESLISGRASGRISWHVHLILCLRISGIFLSIFLKNARGRSLHKSVIATPRRQRWQLRLTRVVWASYIPKCMLWGEHESWLHLSGCEIFALPLFSCPGPHLETRVRDDHIMTHRTFISWMSGHTQHPFQWAPGSGCSVCYGTCVHCTLGSWVYQENTPSPWWMGSVLHLHESRLPRRDKGLGDASLAVPACASQKWWMGLMDKQCRASTHQAQLMWYLFRCSRTPTHSRPSHSYTLPLVNNWLSTLSEPVLARCCR